MDASLYWDGTLLRSTGWPPFAQNVRFGAGLDSRVASLAHMQNGGYSEGYRSRPITRCDRRRSVKERGEPALRSVSLPGDHGLGSGRGQSARS